MDAASGALPATVTAIATATVTAAGLAERDRCNEGHSRDSVPLPFCDSWSPTSSPSHREKRAIKLHTCTWDGIICANVSIRRERWNNGC